MADHCRFTFIEVNESRIRIEDIKANIVNIGGYYSGHADEAGLLKFIFTVNEKSHIEKVTSPATIFINHGDRAARIALKKAIESHEPGHGERQVKAVEFAASDKWYYLDAHCLLDPELPEDGSLQLMLKDISLQQRRTNELFEKLIDLLSNGSARA